MRLLQNILIKVSFVCLIFYLSACSIKNLSKDPPSCDNNFESSLTIVPEGNLEAGNVKFTIYYKLCDKYSGSKIWLSVGKHVEGRWVGDGCDACVDIAKFPVQINSLTGSTVITHYFTEAGTFYVYATINGKDVKPVQSVPNTYIVAATTKKEYKINFVEKTSSNYSNTNFDNILFPSCESSQYYGWIKAFEAFDKADNKLKMVAYHQKVGNFNFDFTKTGVLTEEQKQDPNIPIPINHNSVIQWASKAAGGDLSKPLMGLDPYTSIICAMDNVPFETGGFGYTEQPLKDATGAFQAPTYSFVFYDDYRKIFTIPAEFIAAVTGGGIHELGHARGNLKHCQESNCIMLETLTQTQNNNPAFCDPHKLELKKPENNW